MAAFNSGYGSENNVFGGYSFSSVTKPSREQPTTSEFPLFKKPVTKPSYLEDEDDEDVVYYTADRQRTSRQPLVRESRGQAPDFADDWDDDFDDHFIAPQRGQDRSRNRAAGEPFEDGFDDDFSAQMYQKRPQSNRRMIDDAYSDYHGSAGRDAVMIDQPFSGNGGIPKILQEFMDRAGAHDDGARRGNHRNLSASARGRRGRKTATIVMAAALSFAAVFAAAFYLSKNTAFSPLNVQTAFSALDDATVYSLVKPVVDEHLDGQSFLIMLDGSKNNFYPSECGFGLAVPGDTAEKAIEVTDDKGEVQTQVVVTRGRLTYNETLVKEYLNAIAGPKGGTPMLDPFYEIKNDKLLICAGTDGYGVDYELFMEKIIAAILSESTEPIEVEMQVTQAPPIDIDKIYSQVHCEVEDARRIVDAAGNESFTDDIVGKDFDLEAARQAVLSGQTSFTMLLTLVQPQVTKKALLADTCPDLLSEYATFFTASNKGRTSNLTLAATMIDGYKLMPGQQFSYNQVVGPRTPERGFSRAKIYTSEGTDEDYGGGICQVSSTLYYTVFKADIKVIERQCHMYTVPYMKEIDETTSKEVPIYYDATVDWGRIDFVFENDKEFPIMIKFFIKGGWLTCQIWGTDDGKTAKGGYTELEITYPKVVYKKPTAVHPAGSTTAGQMGRRIKIYRNHYVNGEFVSRELEVFNGVVTNVYRVLNTTNYVNTPPPGYSFSG